MLKHIIAALTLAPALACAQTPQTIAVGSLPAAPKVDGELAEWGASGWTKVAVKPALERDERARFGLDPAGERNTTGSLEVELKAGVAAGRLYVAVRYPDDAADTLYKEWAWRGNKYQRENQLDDLFALRFHMSGEYDRSMLATKEYKVDVWLWSAARSNPSGIAEDMTHFVTTKMQESAAEYQIKDGPVVYIVKRRDEGKASYEVTPRPRDKTEERLPSFELKPAEGSVADVAAKGVWKGGHWQLEFGRALDTGHPDDVAFKPGSRVTGQLAVFNRNASEHKSVSEPLIFDFSALK